MSKTFVLETHLHSETRYHALILYIPKISYSSNIKKKKRQRWKDFDIWFASLLAGPPLCRLLSKKRKSDQSHWCHMHILISFPLDVFALPPLLNIASFISNCIFQTLSRWFFLPFFHLKYEDRGQITSRISWRFYSGLRNNMFLAPGRTVIWIEKKSNDRTFEIMLVATQAIHSFTKRFQKTTYLVISPLTSWWFDSAIHCQMNHHWSIGLTAGLPGPTSNKMFNQQTH